MTTLFARPSICLALALSGFLPGPEPLPQPTVADYEEVATAIVRDLLLESRALGCEEVAHSYIDTNIGARGGIAVWVGCRLGGSWNYRVGYGRVNLAVGRTGGWRAGSDRMLFFGPDGVGAMPALFGTSAGWGPIGPEPGPMALTAATLEPALEARAHAVFARHRAAFSRRFELSEPSDGDGGAQDAERYGTRETVEEFLARTGGPVSAQPADS
jgi:hypothetical protein